MDDFRGVQRKTWATMIKADLGLLSGPRVFGCARWSKGWMKLSSEVAKDCRTWSASGHDVVNTIGDAVSKC